MKILSKQNNHKVIIVDDDQDVNSVLSATLRLNGFDVYKAFTAEECLNRLNALEGKVDAICINGRIAADRGLMLIVKIKKINSNLKICVVAEDENDKTRVLDYGADEFAKKPLSVESIVNKITILLLRKAASEK
jgi:DNA-binding response OmpR family regulator